MKVALISWMEKMRRETQSPYQLVIPANAGIQRALKHPGTAEKSAFMTEPVGRNNRRALRRMGMTVRIGMQGKNDHSVASSTGYGWFMRRNALRLLRPTLSAAISCQPSVSREPRCNPQKTHRPNFRSLLKGIKLLPPQEACSYDFSDSQLSVGIGLSETTQSPRNTSISPLATQGQDRTEP